MQQSCGRAGPLAAAVARWALLGLSFTAQAQGPTLHCQERAPCSATPPDGALAGAGSPLCPALRGAEAMALAADALLVKEGCSYGPQFDRLIAAQTPLPAQASGAGPAAGGLHNVAFSDISAGETRHLYCNRAVPDAWLARIDPALAR